MAGPGGAGWLRGRAAVAAMPLLLAACGGGGGATAPIACPTPGILADASDLTRHAPGAAVRDLTTLDFDARLTGLEGGCELARRGRGIEMSLTARFTVDRGAAARSRTVEIPWSVAVLDARTNEPLGRPQGFLDRIEFGPNETRAAVASQPVSILLPVGPERGAMDYRVLVFFQLTPEELEMNRRRGPR